MGLIFLITFLYLNQCIFIFHYFFINSIDFLYRLCIYEHPNLLLILELTNGLLIGAFSEARISKGGK